MLFEVRISKIAVPDELVVIPQKGDPCSFLLAKSCGISLSFARPKATCPLDKTQAFKLPTQKTNATIEIIKCQLPENMIFIASTYGALEFARSLPFINPMIAKLLIKYMIATQIVPSTTALGIVFAGLLTDPAGAVANSTPTKHHKVRSVERARICDVVRLDISLLMMKLFLLKKTVLL